MTVVISATGLYTPPNSISNAELVASYNAYVERYNAEHAAEIAAETLAALQPSSVEFIEKASGIKHRYVLEKEGLLDIDRMVPDIPERPNEDLSLMAEVSVIAAKQALGRAGLFCRCIYVGMSPLIGLHTVLGLLVAWVFKLNKFVSIVGIYVTNPWTIIPIYTFGTWCGAKLLGVHDIIPTSTGTK